MSRVKCIRETSAICQCRPCCDSRRNTEQANQRAVARRDHFRRVVREMRGLADIYPVADFLRDAADKLERM